MVATDYYELILTLHNKTTTGDPANELVNVGKVIDGDLLPFRHRVELLNVGNSRGDSGVITLRIPPDGTFVRTEPLLADETAKDDYIIQAQIRQPDGLGGETSSKLFRFTIGRPTIQDDPDVGETLKLQLIPMEYRVKETLQSRQLFFRTPQESFSDRLNDYNTVKGADEPALTLLNIDLPNNEALRQNWEPLAPARTHDLLKEVMDRLSLPGVSGGVFIDQYFDFEANETDVGFINVTAEEFGKTSSNVVIDPLSVSAAETEQDKSINVDMIQFKNNIVLECSPRGGSVPMEKTRFTSNHEHAKQREPIGSLGVEYNDGVTDPTKSQSLVRQEIIGFEPTFFFKCIQSHTSTISNTPFGATGDQFWDMDFVIIPPYDENAEYYDGEETANNKIRNPLSVVSENHGLNTHFYELVSGVGSTRGGSVPPSGGNATWLEVVTFPTAQITTYFSYTPWTNDWDAQKSNLSDLNTPPTDTVPDPDVSYVGLLPDWNYVRANYDRVEADDNFETISLKYITRTSITSNDPANIPTGEQFNGARFLINGTGAVGTDWENHDNQIAEWNQPPGISFSGGTWRFSNTPTNGAGNDEAISDLNTAQIHKWNSSTNAWELGFWDLPSDNTVTAPFHAVRDLYLTTGSTNISGQAVRLRFDWNAVPLIPPNSSFFNLSSRGAWYHMQFPFPRQAVSGHTIGDLYGNSTLDSTNLDFDRLGQRGWNNGLDSEDLGRITRLSMKMRLSILDSSENLLNGYANMPMTAWAVDIFDRIWFAPFTLRRNGQYSLVKIAFGATAPQQIHHNRIDELFTIYGDSTAGLPGGFTFSQNFFLKEKEFTGIEFDWRFIRGWGVMWNVSYDDNGMYIGVRDNFTQTVSQWASQLGSYALAGITLGGIPAQSLITDHVFLDIDELAFEKQLIVNSDDTAVAKGRSELAHLFSENDYLNAKSRAKGIRERKKFINQSWYMKAHGDVRMRFGNSFIAKGSRVPFPRDQSDERNLVCAEVKHVIDNDGYMMELTGVKKFQLSN